MPWIKISSETHKAIKEYLVDVEGLTIGDFVDDAVLFAMDNIEKFEEYAEIEDIEEEEEEGESEEEEENEEEENEDEEEDED